MDPRSSEVFLLPPKVTIEPESTEEIKIRFQPDRSGTYMLKLEFLVTSLIRDETNLRWQRLPNVMNIGGVAETPNIELIFNENKYLDFGEMTYGSCRKQELKLLNKGRADVPVHLQILSNVNIVCFLVCLFGIFAHAIRLFCSMIIWKFVRGTNILMCGDVCNIFLRYTFINLSFINLLFEIISTYVINFFMLIMM